MNLRSTPYLFAALALATLLFPARADDKTSTSTAAQRFAALKKLAGDWVEVGKDGKPTDKVFTSFRVTAAGTTLLETVFPGGDDEMITMYHLDGDDLILTHYCTFGNQPRMRGTWLRRQSHRFQVRQRHESEDRQRSSHGPRHTHSC